MKKYLLSMLSILMMGMLSVNLASCGSDDDDEPTPPERLSVTPTEISLLSQKGSSASFTITTNTTWTVSCMADWLNLSAKSGDGNSSITVTTLTANPSSEVRTAQILVQAGSLSQVVTVSQMPGSLSVTPKDISLLPQSGSSASFTIVTDGEWSITDIPEWLHLNATTGVGNATLSAVATSENFSDETRKATLSISTTFASAVVTVEQKGMLPQNLRVTMSNILVMSDGFACDLAFGSETKGYKEAFFTEEAVNRLTERDIYNSLMEEPEYEGSLDWTYSPLVYPQTTIYYCIAAYGNENNVDGTHKYGPMTMKKITTLALTPYADMPVSNIGYNLSSWSPVTKKHGAWGTRCAKYYYFCAENESAEELALYSFAISSAMIAHFFYKPWIQKSPNEYAINEQTFSYQRSGNKCFFGTWGIDDGNNYSAELMYAYRDLSSASSSVMMAPKEVASPSTWNAPRRIPTKQEIETLRKSLKVYRVQ